MSSEVDVIKNASKTANLIAACFLFVACGGDGEGDDDGNNTGGGTSAGSNTGSTGTATTGTATTGATSGGSSTGSSTGGNGATTGNGSTTGSSTGSNSGTTGAATGGDDGGVDPGSSTTGGGGGGDDPATPGNDSATSVQCGANIADCNLTSKSCCGTGVYPLITFSCTAGTTCSQGMRTVCDGPEDCGSGEMCCVSIAKAGEVSCSKTACDGSELCHTDEDCSKAGSRCEKGTIFVWGLCK